MRRIRFRHKARDGQVLESDVRICTAAEWARSRLAKDPAWSVATLATGQVVALRLPRESLPSPSPAK